MLNCILLLDSANRFGLKEGMCNFPRDAKKSLSWCPFLLS